MLPPSRKPGLVDDGKNLDNVSAQPIDDAVREPNDRGASELPFDLLVVQRRLLNMMERLIYLFKELAAEAISFRFILRPSFKQPRPKCRDDMKSCFRIRPTYPFSNPSLGLIPRYEPFGMGVGISDALFEHGMLPFGEVFRLKAAVEGIGDLPPFLWR